MTLEQAEDRIKDLEQYRDHLKNKIVEALIEFGKERDDLQAENKRLEKQLAGARNDYAKWANKARAATREFDSMTRRHIRDLEAENKGLKERLIPLRKRIHYFKDGSPCIYCGIQREEFIKDETRECGD